MTDERNAETDVEVDPAEESAEGVDDSLMQGYITLGMVAVVCIVFVIFCIPILFS